MINKFLKIEFRRTVFRWNTLLGFILFIGAFIHISLMNKMDIPTHAKYPIILALEEGNLFISYIKAFAGSVNSYMPLIFPLIIALIIGDSLFIDYKTGFLQFYLSRVDYIKYIKSKILSVSLVSFISTFVFQIVAFLYSVFSSPYHLPTKVAVENYMAPKLATDFYLKNPFLYIIAIMTIMSLVAMVIATWGIMASIVLKNIFSVIILPWIIYLVFSQLLMFIAPETNYILYYISPINMIGPFIFDGSISFIQVFLYWLILWITSYFISYRLFIKKFKLSY